MGEKVTSRGGGAIVKHMARLDPRPGSDAGRFGGANMPDRHESGRSRGTGDERRSAYSVLTLVRAFGVSPVMRPPRRRANGYAACIGSGTVGCSRHGERPRHSKHYSPLTSSHIENRFDNPKINIYTATRLGTTRLPRVSRVPYRYGINTRACPRLVRSETGVAVRRA